MGWRWLLAAGLLLWMVGGGAVWARPVLLVSMRLAQSVSPKFWYVVALSRAGSPGPTANLVDPNVRLGPDEVAFVRGWDYLIRVKPLAGDQQGLLLQATIQAQGSIEQEFSQGFNEVSLRQTNRPNDTLSLTIDLQPLTLLDPVNQDIHVSLLTIRDPLTLAPDVTNLAIDATRGELPHYYRLSLGNQRQVLVEDPRRNETLRRSRELITQNAGQGLTTANIEGSSLEILAANILTFSLRLEDR
ncbi:MAG: hypothetical protein Q6K99_03135 [Thermostichales cyanobacterium BF4_bins_65]